MCEFPPSEWDLSLIRHPLTIPEIKVSLLHHQGHLAMPVIVVVGRLLSWVGGLVAFFLGSLHSTFLY